MQYIVKGQYGRGGEVKLEEFKQLNEATTYIEKKLVEDDTMRVKVTYRIYEFGDVIKEYDPDKVDISSFRTPSQEQQGSQGKGSGASFRPTPLSTTPRPPGSPQNWVKDDDEEKKE